MYGVLRGNSCLHPNAEKIAAALGLPFEKTFDDITENISLSGSTVNKIKLNLSAIFTAAVKKEIMRRNPCKLVTPPKADTRPSRFLMRNKAGNCLTCSTIKAIFNLKLSRIYFLLRAYGRVNVPHSIGKMSTLIRGF
jgi:hypothetical protein